MKATRCVVHRQVIAAWKLEPGVQRECCIGMVDFIKTRPLNRGVFTILGHETGSDQGNLLCHTEVCLLVT